MTKQFVDFVLRPIAALDYSVISLGTLGPLLPELPFTIRTSPTETPVILGGCGRNVSLYTRATRGSLGRKAGVGPLGTLGVLLSFLPPNVKWRTSSRLGVVYFSRGDGADRKMVALHAGLTCQKIVLSLERGKQLPLPPRCDNLIPTPNHAHHISNNTMSFGYSIGDLIALFNLLNTVRKQFVDAPAQFKAISDE